MFVFFLSWRVLENTESCLLRSVSMYFSQSFSSSSSRYFYPNHYWVTVLLLERQNVSSFYESLFWSLPFRSRSLRCPTTKNVSFTMWLLSYSSPGFNKSFCLIFHYIQLLLLLRFYGEVSLRFSTPDVLPQIPSYSHCFHFYNINVSITPVCRRICLISYNL